MLVTQLIFLSFSSKACYTLLVTVMRISATVSWFPSMPRPPTHQSTVCVYRIYSPGCKRKRLDLMYFCWTCVAKGVKGFFQINKLMYQLFLCHIQALFTWHNYVFWWFLLLETQMMTSLYSQDWSKWQQTLCLDTPRKFHSFSNHVGVLISLLCFFAFNKSVGDRRVNMHGWNHLPEKISVTHA